MAQRRLRESVEVRMGPAPGLVMAAVGDPNLVLTEVKGEVALQMFELEATEENLENDLVLADSLVVNVMFGDVVLDEDQPDGLFRPENPFERDREWWQSMPTGAPSSIGDAGGRMFIFSLEGFDVYNMIEALYASGGINDAKAFEMLGTIARALNHNTLADIAEEVSGQ